jgi:hypothetical protein
VTLDEQLAAARARVAELEKAVAAERQSKRVFVDEPFTCPMRPTSPVFVASTEGEDRWEKVGGDRVCSFCGSMHPDEALAVFALAQSDERVGVDLCDGRDKVRFRRPGVGNAMQGALKFRMAHAPRDPDGLLSQAFVDAANAAIRATLLRWRQA